MNVLCVVGAILLWLLAAAAIRRGRPFSQALRLEAYAFLPFLGIILLVALDNYVYPGIVLFAVHAVTLAVAGFAGITAYLVVSAPRSQVSLERAPGRAGIAAAITAAGVYFAVFAAMNTLQYYSLAISYTDTADWEQMLYNTLHGRFLMSSAFPHMFFGEHVQFIHLLLLPLYALFPSLVTLMVAESLALASGAVAVYLVAARRLGSAGSALCFAGAYLLYPAMQYVDLELVYNTFRPETFAIPALLWAVYFLDTGPDARVLGGGAPCARCQGGNGASGSDARHPCRAQGQKRVGGARSPRWALLWFVVSVFVVIPHFRQGASHMGRYYQDFWNIDAAGASLETPLSGVVVNILRNPLHAIAVMLQPVKVDYLLMLLVPLGLLPLLSWRMVLVMLPSLATALLASRLPSFTIYNHYQIPLVPFLSMGAVYGAEQALRWSARRAGEGSGARQPAIRTGLAAYVLFAALAGNVLLAKSPLSLNFYNPSMQTYWRSLYVPDARSRLFFKEVRPLVPERASVSATEFAATYFARRERRLCLSGRASGGRLCRYRHAGPVACHETVREADDSRGGPPQGSVRGCFR